MYLIIIIIPISKKNRSGVRTWPTLRITSWNYFPCGLLFPLTRTSLSCFWGFLFFFFSLSTLKSVLTHSLKLWYCDPNIVHRWIFYRKSRLVEPLNFGITWNWWTNSYVLTVEILLIYVHINPSGWPASSRWDPQEREPFSPCEESYISPSW